MKRKKDKTLALLNEEYDKVCSACDVDKADFYPATK